MEVSALRYSGGIGLHGRPPLLRLQSDERLVTLTRRGSPAAFEVLVSRYQARLLAFTRHLLGSREDAEDVLQEAFSAAFNAILADDRPINVRPWLYRIARNRSLNHLRRVQAVGVDSMDIHLSDYGASTADRVHDREDFRLLVEDIHGLPETQRTALVLREMDALSYEQIAEAMETTVPSVKSLLVRARVSLAEAGEARLLSCAEVRMELGEVAEGLQRKPGALVRRHLRSCTRCSSFRTQLKETNQALTALLPLGPLALLKKLAITHLGHSAGAGSGASGAGTAGAMGSSAGAVGSSAAAGTTAVVGPSAGSLISAGVGTVATKATAGLAAAALLTAGAVEVSHVTPHRVASHVATADTKGIPIPVTRIRAHPKPAPAHPRSAHKPQATTARSSTALKLRRHKHLAHTGKRSAKHKLLVERGLGARGLRHDVRKHKSAPAGRHTTQTDPTVLAPTTTTSTTSTTTPPCSQGGTPGTPDSGAVGLGAGSTDGGTAGAGTTDGGTGGTPPGGSPGCDSSDSGAGTPPA